MAELSDVKEGSIKIAETAKKARGSKGPAAMALLINEKEANKIVHCAFHHVLPWLALLPKHGHVCLVWDYENNKLINELHFMDLLSVQSPHPSAAGKAVQSSWTENLVGQTVLVQFIDESCLMWHQHLTVNNLGSATEASHKLESKLFGPAGPRHADENVTAAGVRVSFNSTPPTTGVRSFIEKDQGSSILIVAQHVSAIISVGTGTLHRVLPASYISNRVVRCATMVPVVSVDRPLIIMGCNDGCLCLWDPFANFTVGCTGTIRTPHSSAVSSLTLFNYLGSRAASSTVNIEGDSSFFGAHVSVAFGTDGGSVTRLRVLNRDEASVEFSQKKVHDTVFSVVATPLPAADRHADAAGLRPDAVPSEFNEFVSSVENALFIISLGPQNLIMQDARTGAELRKLQVKGMFRDLVAGPTALYLIGKGHVQYTVDYNLNSVDSIEPFCDTQVLMERAQAVAQNAVSTGSTGTLMGPSGTDLEKISIVPLAASASAAMLLDKDTAESPKVYNIVLSPMGRNTVAVCTGCGVMLLDRSVECSVGSIHFARNLPSPSTEELEFVHFDKATGKTSSTSIAVPVESLMNQSTTQLLLPLVAEVSPKLTVASSTAQNTRISRRRQIVEPFSASKVSSLHPSPCFSLLAAVTETNEIRLFDVAQDYVQVTVPTMGRADVFVWNANSTCFGIMNRDTKKITIAFVKKGKSRVGAPVYTVPSTTYDVTPANVPIGISGGRWLCVHYLPSFSGLSSQFYRWESTMAGGGAVGGFIPQPKLIQWDSTGTLCALAYPSSIVFMQTRRKNFSRLCATDIQCPPTAIMFSSKSLFVVFPREIVVLLPTSGIVQQLVVASIDPGVIAEVQPPSRDPRRAARSVSSYTVALRPLGNLTLQTVVQHVTQSGDHALLLLISDESNYMYLVPLSNSLVQLLMYIHRYTAVGTPPADRLFVQRTLLANAMTPSIGSGGVFAVAVQEFCQICGCDVLGRAAEAGILRAADASLQGGALDSSGSHSSFSTSAAGVDMNCIDGEMSELVEWKASSRATTPEGLRRQEELLLACVGKLMRNVAERHGAGWITRESAMRHCLDGLKSAILSASDDATEWSALRCECLKEVAFKVFTEIPPA